MNDQYQTIEKPTEEILFKDKGSKFYGYAFPIHSEDQAKEHLENIKKLHNSARHHCYAWQLGYQKDKIQYRINDDGEPSNTAGAPIHGQILSFGLTDVFIVVVRYFGGVKLGVSGLINAYRTTAQMALEQAMVIEKTIDVHFRLLFEYKHINEVMRIIKEKNLNILDQKMHLSCEIIIGIRQSKAEDVIAAFAPLYEVKLKRVET